MSLEGQGFIIYNLSRFEGSKSYVLINIAVGNILNHDLAAKGHQGAGSSLSLSKCMSNEFY